MTQTKSKTPLVRAVLQIGTETYASTGETILEAIDNLKKPEFLKSKGFLKVEVDGKTATKHFTIPTLRRLFCTSDNIRGYVRSVVSKHLTNFLQ